MNNNNNNNNTNSATCGDENMTTPPSIDSSDASFSNEQENASSVTLIVSTTRPLSNVPQNSPRISLLRPPEYAAIVDAINETNNLPKFINRTQGVHIHITPPVGQTAVIQGPPPLDGAPPTYSAIMRIGPIDMGMTRGRRTVRIQPSPPFIAPRPPPSYAETQGVYTRNLLQRSALEEYVLTNHPVRLICPNCSRMITTSIYMHRSNLTHFSAIVLFMCGCWPCCFIPYCMKSCKTTHHYCPDCETYLGMYTPW